MKCIVLVSGILRTFYDTLYPFLCKVNNYIEVQLYICTSPDIQDAKYQGRNYMEQIQSCIENPMCKACLIEKGIEYPNLDKRENNTLQQWHKLQILFQSLNPESIANDDIILRIRPDVEVQIFPEEFAALLIKHTSSDYVYIPTGNDIFDKRFTHYTTNTLNDQIAFGSYAPMKQYFLCILHWIYLHYQDPLLVNQFYIPI